MKNERLEIFDLKYKGKLNPRCTIHCQTCNRYYSDRIENLPKDDSPVFTLTIDESTGNEDCVHYTDIEVTEKIYETHMEILKANGFLKDYED